MKALHGVGQTPVHGHEHVAENVNLWNDTVAVLNGDGTLNAFGTHCGYLAPIKPRLWFMHGKMAFNCIERFFDLNEETTWVFSV